MKSRTVIILWIFALILAASVFVIKTSDGNENANATNRSPGETFLPDFPAKKAATIYIKGVDQEVTLTRKDGTWTVGERDNFPANIRNINDLLRTLAEIKVTQGIEAGPSFAPRFGMDGDSSDPETHGLTATFKDSSGKELATVSFGKNLDVNSSSPFGGGSTGRFVRNHADDSGFYAVSELFGILSADPKDWLADDFFKVERIQTISLSKPGSDENEWTLTRDDENAEFIFTEAFPGVKIDTAAVTPLKSLFSFARFDDVVPASEIERRSTPDQLQKVKITTFEGLAYDITLQPAKSLEDTEEGEQPPSDETFLMTVDISGDVPEERKKVEGETEDAATAADQAFKERRDALLQTIEETKKVEGRTFEVSKFTVDALLKDRAELMDKGDGPGNAQNPPSGPTSLIPPEGIRRPAQQPAPPGQPAPQPDESPEEPTEE